MSGVAELVGLRVQEARQQHDMTQEQIGAALAEYLGKPWTRQAVSAAEKGNRAFKIAELFALAAVLDTTVVELIAPRSSSAEVELPAAHLTAERYAALLSRDRSEVEAELRDEVDRLRKELGSVVQVRDILESALHTADRHIVETADARAALFVPNKGAEEP